MNNLEDISVNTMFTNTQFKSDPSTGATLPQHSHGKTSNKRKCKHEECYRCISVSLLVILSFTLSMAIVFLNANIEQYARKCVTIYVSSEGLKAILSAAGLAGFPLSYIISSKTNKIQGFAFDDIVKFHFPKYGLVFVFQAIAVIFGLYSFYIKKITSLGLFTIITLLCLSYTAWMATFSVFSEKFKTSLAKMYLEFHLKNTNNPNIHVIMDYCRYLSEKYKDTFLAASIALHYDASDSYSNSKSEIARFHADILPVLTYSSKNEQCEIRASNSSCKDIHLSSAANAEDDDTKEFKAFFDASNYQMKYDPTQSLELIRKHPLECAILFEIPKFKTRFSQIKSDLLPLIEMWEGLIGNEKDLRKQAAVIFAVLYQSIREQTFVGRMRLVEISLLICIARHKGKTQEGNVWEQIMLLLYYCDTIATQTIEAAPNGVGKNNLEVYDREIRKTFKDISITAYAFAVLSQASTNNEIPLKLIAGMLTLFSWRNSEKLKEESALQYLCYANVVLSNVWMPDQSKMTPSELYLALPHIVRALLYEVNSENY